LMPHSQGRRKMTECLTDRIDLYLESLPPPTGRTFHQMQPETLLSECRTTIDLQASVIIGYQNDLQKLEKAYAQQQQVWSDAIARADRYEAALNKCVNIVETYRIPVGNSAAGEMACEWTYDALKQIRDDMKDVISAALAGEKKDD
jgi:hypothetical protein